jgi:hypothetical protein
MSKNHVFLIHGMGQHETGWSDSWKKCITDNLRQFDPYTDMSAAELDADVRLVELTYDSVFELGFRQRWKTLAGAVASAELPGPVRTVLDELAQSGDARVPEFFFTHVLDVLLWFSLGQARQAAIAKLGKELATKLKSAQAEGADVHLLAHSLGTSVVHDTLLCLAAAKKTAKAFDPKLGGLRWKSLTTVANVSCLLTARESPSDDLVVEDFRPHSSRVQSGDLVQNFVVVRHRVDPFTFPRTFNPHWDTPELWKFEPDRFDELMHVHDLETQFDNPEVARRCLRLFTGIDTLGTPDEMDVCRDRYKQKYGKSAGDAFSRMHQILGPDEDRKLGVGELARYLGEIAKEVVRS